MSIADQIASAIDARKSGDWWRTSTEHCHGGDTVDGLAFRSPDEEPDKLIIRCFSHGCHESLEGLNRARDNLRQAAGLSPWQPSAPGHRATTDGNRQRRTGRRVPTSNPDPKTPRKGVRGTPDGGTATYAVQLWTVATVSTGKAPEYHPVSRWLADKAPGGLWPPGVPLPEAVRWLPREKMPAGKDVRSDSKAAGAVVLAMRRLDAPCSIPARYIWSVSTPMGTRRNIGQVVSGQTNIRIRRVSLRPTLAHTARDRRRFPSARVRGASRRPAHSALCFRSSGCGCLCGHKLRSNRSRLVRLGYSLA